MDISFVVITNGKKPDKLSLVLKAIHHQKLKNYEIFVSGDLDTIKEEEGWTYVEAKEAASCGNLAEMRNKACKLAQYENLLLLDDDMILSTNFCEKLEEHGNDFDILTSQVRLPDGTRFWDHCCYQDPVHGHVVLEHDEEAENLYMSGGMAWLMKKYVFEKDQWDSKKYDYYNMSNLAEYKEGKHNEDTDFAKRCREHGFKIKHHHEMVSYHDDPGYTAVGRIVRKRRNNRTHEWIKNFDIYFPTESLAKYAISLFNSGYFGEAADIVRKGLAFHYMDYNLIECWKNIESSHGYTLSDSKWNENGDEEYLKDINFYKQL